MRDASPGHNRGWQKFHAESVVFADSYCQHKTWISFYANIALALQASQNGLDFR
jgi:hypothetical protein